MTATIGKLNARQWLLLAVMLIVGFFFVRRYFGASFGAAPTNARIENAQKRLETSVKLLKAKQLEEGEQLKELRNLRQMSSSLWREERDAKQEVMEEFSKLARRASVNNVTFVNPRESKFMTLSEIKQIEFSVSLTASMREVTRLISEVEQSRRHFYWSQCTMRPDNAKAPTKVRLSGRLRVLVLSKDAEEFLNMQESDS